MKKRSFGILLSLVGMFVFQPLLSWRNGISIAENAGIYVRIAAIFVLIQETSDQIDATCEQMLANVKETFVS